MQTSIPFRTKISKHSGEASSRQAKICSFSIARDLSPRPHPNAGGQLFRLRHFPRNSGEPCPVNEPSSAPQRSMRLLVLFSCARMSGVRNVFLRVAALSSCSSPYPPNRQERPPLARLLERQRLRCELHCLSFPAGHLKRTIPCRPERPALQETLEVASEVFSNRCRLSFSSCTISSILDSLA